MQDMLIDRWRASGIEDGDTLLIHSNIKRTLIEFRRQGMQITPDDILNSFISAVGPKGTLLLPLFNFDFTSGTPFNYYETPSHMGALTESGRLYKGAVRTGHPIYSFAVIGNQSEKFRHVDNESGYSEESPFGILKQLNGKIAVLDLPDQNSMTFYHHVEEVKRVDYRYFKTFTGSYTNKDNEKTEKSYKLYVRDIEHGVRTDVNPAGELMWENGIYSGDRPKIGSGLRVAKAQDIFTFVSDIIDSGKALGTLYSVGEL